MAGAGSRHLICIIHGVGQHDAVKRKERTEEMIRNKNLLLPRLGGDVEDFEFRFTEWHSEVKANRDFISEVSMPHGAKIIKTVMKDVVSDVLFYAESAHRDRILASVAAQINLFIFEFTSKYPESSDNLHIIAHSLGSVVAYDLLCSHYSRSMPAIKCSTGAEIPQLECDPKNLFICGSPLGLFLSIRGGSGSSASTGAPLSEPISMSSMISPLSGCLGKTRCRNVIHPLDVLAYRLEPLLFECPSEQPERAAEQPQGAASPSPSTGCEKKGSWATFQPVDIPYWKGRDHTHNKIKNIGKLLSKSLSFRSGGGREEAAGEGTGGGEKIVAKNPAAPGFKSSPGFRQGLSSMFRRGLKRVEKGGGAHPGIGEEGLLLDEKDGSTEHCVGGEIEQEIEERAEMEGPCRQNLPEYPSALTVNVDEIQEDGGRGMGKQAGEEKRRDYLVSEEASGMVRVDYKLQQSAAESMSDFISSIRSHRAYWHSKDFLLFVLNCAAHGQESVGTDSCLQQLAGPPESPSLQTGTELGVSKDEEDDDDGGEIGLADDDFVEGW